MLDRAKRILEHRLPALHASLREVRRWERAARLRRAAERRFGDDRRAARRLLYRGGEVRVLSGPFAGLRYLDAAVWGPIVPRWLGSYECELHPVVEALRARRYPLAVDLGCAEGYYAVGLVAIGAAARCVACDTDPWSRRQCRRLAELNEVGGRVAVAGELACADLERLLDREGPCLVVCDIEGAEVELLDPLRVPSLARCDLLVETHRRADGDSAPLLAERFAATHDLERLLPGDRDPARLREACGGRLDSARLARVLDEHRHRCTGWLHLRTRLVRRDR